MQKQLEGTQKYINEQYEVNFYIDGQLSLCGNVSNTRAGEYKYLK